jgi:O-antigen/teichoic acid export membrane protein
VFEYACYNARIYSAIGFVCEHTSEAPLLTIRVLKVSLIIGVCCVLVLFLIPVKLYQVIFGQEFGYVRLVIIYLSPGIISVVGHSIIAHYFSGTGRHYLNTIGSAIGLAVVAGVGILIVPGMGLKGAAIASSLAYVISFVFHITVFMKITGTSLYALIPSKEDARFIIHKFYRSFKNQHPDKRYDNY